MMLKEESKKQLITRATQYGVDPMFFHPGHLPTTSTRPEKNYPLSGKCSILGMADPILF